MNDAIALRVDLIRDCRPQLPSVVEQHGRNVDFVRLKDFRQEFSVLCSAAGCYSLGEYIRPLFRKKCGLNQRANEKVAHHEFDGCGSCDDGRLGKPGFQEVFCLAD